MLGQGRLGHSRQNGDPVLRALTVANDDLIHREIDILHSQTGAFEQAQSRPVEKRGHQADRAFQLGDDRPHFVAGEHDGQVLCRSGPHDVFEPGQVLMQNVAIQEQERAQRLILGRCGHAPLDGQRAQKLCDLRGAHFGGMALAMKQNEAADPSDVGLLRTPAAVTQPISLTHAVEQPSRPRATVDLGRHSW